ncbi:hypothetical protein [Labilibaculum sp.]|uniref:hypothetical protein n=1 Tax=Labilibaculum sp. TaxID=2060723 RepID=UPI002AA5F4F1|nr:hypothetical protein [Labilibaculum sp.]
MKNALIRRNSSRFSLELFAEVWDSPDTFFNSISPESLVVFLFSWIKKEIKKASAAKLKICNMIEAISMSSIIIKMVKYSRMSVTSL